MPAFVQPWHEEHPVQAMYEDMLLEKIKRDGRNGKISFIKFLQACNVYDEWILRKDVIPNAAIHRMLLAEELKTATSKIFEAHQGEGDVEKSKIEVPEGSFEGMVGQTRA